MFRCDALGPYLSDDSMSHACRDFELASGAQKADVLQTGWTPTIGISAVLSFDISKNSRLKGSSHRMQVLKTVSLAVVAGLIRSTLTATPPFSVTSSPESDSLVNTTSALQLSVNTNVSELTKR